LARTSSKFSRLLPDSAARMRRSRKMPSRLPQVNRNEPRLEDDGSRGMMRGGEGLRPRDGAGAQAFTQFRKSGFRLR